MITGKVVVTTKQRLIVRHTDYTVEVPHAGIIQAKSIKEILARVPDEASLNGVNDGGEGLTLKFTHIDEEKA